MCRSALPVQQKADASPVTEADRQAEAAMRELIHSSFPAHAVFGEEGGMHAGEGLAEGAAQYLWVLDPIDGTKSFVTGCCCPALHPLKGGLLC
jgi:inositol-phosphate phosphatase/L-galactose 1-phosphate phosphatase/histidinol-phosphatase